MNQPEALLDEGFHEAVALIGSWPGFNFVGTEHGGELGKITLCHSPYCHIISYTSLRKLEHSAALEKAITVYGQPENCTAACKRIMEVFFLILMMITVR